MAGADLGRRVARLAPMSALMLRSAGFLCDAALITGPRTNTLRGGAYSSPLLQILSLLVGARLWLEKGPGWVLIPLAARCHRGVNIAAGRKDPLGRPPPRVYGWELACGAGYASVGH